MCCESSDRGGRRSRTARAIATIGMTLLVSGCLSIEVPDEFVVVADGASEIKAMSADETMLWVREFDDRDGGDLEFWSRALEEELVGRRGYTLLEQREVTDGDGIPGREFLFEVTVNRSPHRYLITLFVEEGSHWFPASLWSPDTVRVAEYAAEKGRFDGYLDGVRAAIATISS